MNTILQQLRKERRLTQVQVANIVGISEISYQRIEYGTQRPNLDTAIQIARTLGGTVEQLFEVATPDNAKEPDGNPAEKIHTNRITETIQKVNQND